MMVKTRPAERVEPATLLQIEGEVDEERRLDAGERQHRPQTRRKGALGERPQVERAGCPRRARRRCMPTKAARMRPVLVPVALRRAVAVVIALRPTTSSTSARMSSCTTPSASPTLSAIKPSRAASTSSPSASRICADSGISDASAAVTTRAARSLLMAVPPVLSDLVSAPTLATGADEAGGPPIKVPRGSRQPPRVSSRSPMVCQPCRLQNCTKHFRLSDF
jgi:hypothetical protein